jgi:hypothetical protein
MQTDPESGDIVWAAGIEEYDWYPEQFDQAEQVRCSRDIELGAA